MAEKAHNAIIREDYTHPEKLYKNLIYYDPELGLPPESRKQLKDVRGMGTIYKGVNHAEDELCWSCGWTVYNQMTSGYGSRIRIFHTNGTTGIWEVGSRWLIRDKPNDTSLGSDFITQEFLRNQPNLDIPLIKEMRKLSAPTDKVDLTLMSRARGVGLDTIWDSLSLEQKKNYANQLGNALEQWRQFESPTAKKVDGGPMEDCLVGNCLRRTAPTCKKIGRTRDEWFEILEKDLRFGLSRQYKTEDPLIIDVKYKELKKNFPKSEPYVLTHGDLNLTNIIVKDDKIEAIVDWEYSGYLPWWAERWLSLWNGENSAREFFDLLWADHGSGIPDATFRKKISHNVGPVLEAWDQCRFYTEHKGSEIRWLRLGFCECKPWGGWFKWSDLGNVPEHNLTGKYTEQ